MVRETRTLVELEVPYEEGPFWPFKRQREGTFRLLIGSLPPTPGKLTLHHTVTRSFEERRHVVTQTWLQDSNNNDIPDDVSHGGLKLHHGPAHPGWQIDRDSIRLVVERVRGRQFTGGNWEVRYELRQSEPVVAFGVGTVHRSNTWLSRLDSGLLQFHFEYDLTRIQTVKEWVAPEEVRLRWGDSQAFPYAAGDWKLVYQSIDGSSHEIVGAHSSPFLNVRGENGNLIVRATEPRLVNWQ